MGDLKQLIELDVDFSDNIYIVGFISNNLYILLSLGKCIRVIENIFILMFCKVNEDECIICVCSGIRNIKFYQF